MAVNGCCVLFLAVVSVFLGVVCFQTYTKPYKIYSASQFYQNVSPTAPVGAYRDAGSIDFAKGSRVDVDRSVGFKIYGGDLYCVAPIVGPDSNGPSGFWAAGMNCCNMRGGFKCGEASKSEVRSGLVVIDENRFGVDEIPEYTKAAKLAAAQFSLLMPAKPIFMRWTSGVSSLRDQYYQDAWTFVISSAAGLFVFMLVIVVGISTMASYAPAVASFYSVEVYDFGDAEQSKRGKRSKKANRSTDPFLNNL